MNYNKAAEEALHTITSGFSLAYSVTGSQYAMFLSLSVQAALYLYQAGNDISKGRYIEAASKLGLMTIRVHKVKVYKIEMQKRQAILSKNASNSLLLQALKERKAAGLLSNPLIDLIADQNGEIDAKKAILSSPERKLEAGSHCHGFGEDWVKGANLEFRNVEIEGKKRLECEFKLNHVHRENIQTYLDELQKLSPTEIRDILRATNSHAQSIQITECQDLDGENPFKSVYLIKVAGLGQITIGSSKEYPNLYDRVVILMETNSIFDLHSLLALTNLDTALILSSKDGLDRLKLGQLFRTFFPKEATLLERSKEFFTCSVQELLEKMIEKCPQMREVYDEYFDRMEKTEIFPGKVRYVIRGLADKVYSLGGRQLTAVVTGTETEEEAFKRVASICSIGMLSQEQRDKLRFNKVGLSGTYDTGGADSVYAQMLTRQDEVKGGFDTSRSAYSDCGEVNVFISLSILETGTYQHTEDVCGIRLVDGYGGRNREGLQEIYLKRLNILDFTKAVQLEKGEVEHEIMIKDRIHPRYITGFGVKDEQTRDKLVDYLRVCGLVKNNSLGRETILEIPVENFIRINPLPTETAEQTDS